MQGVILAGGRGVRLRPLTDTTPKPMVRIKGKPFLSYQLEYIKKFGIKRILLLLGYLGEQIEDFFKDGRELGLELKYSYERTPLGTAGAIKNAENMIDKDFALFNGDTFLPINLSDIIFCYFKHGKKGLLVGYRGEKRSSCNLAVNSNNLVTAYSAKGGISMTHTEAGVMIFSKEILNLIPKNKNSSIGDCVYKPLIDSGELMVYPTEEQYYDIGSFTKLKIINMVL